VSDILVVWDVQNARGDWALNAAGNDLAKGPSLYAAAYISTFTDRLAAPDDIIPDGTTNRRGHWTDTGSDYLIGSRMWLLDRSKHTKAVLLKARDYLIEAYQWMIDDGLIAKVDVVTEWTRPNMLGAAVTFYQRGQPPVSLNYSWAWGELS
jgi:phage gp46-like protein